MRKSEIKILGRRNSVARVRNVLALAPLVSGGPKLRHTARARERESQFLCAGRSLGLPTRSVASTVGERERERELVALPIIFSVRLIDCYNDWKTFVVVN